MAAFHFHEPLMKAGGRKFESCQAHLILAKMELPKEYNWKDAEKKWQEYWIKNKIFAFNPTSKAKTYSIDTPPPTVSGKMHLGHAFSYSHFDFIARYKRMAGFNVFFPWGFDDNGLATEIFVESKTGKFAEKMPRSDFAKLCLENTTEAEKSMLESWQSIGMSCDWAIFYRTISKEVQKISQKSFLDLYKEKRAYRKEDPAIWCVKCRTAIAQAELEDTEAENAFYYLMFEVPSIKKTITIATTRPEFLPACVAIFVNPRDTRYKEFIGKKAKLPLVGREVPIIASDNANPEKGTGAVYICTFGDYEDVTWVKSENLPTIQILNPDGRFNEKAGKYSGLKIKEGREKIIADLKSLGALIKEEKIKNIVNVHERCRTPAEYIIAKQWFIKYLDLREKFLEEGKKLQWHPPHMYHRLEHWINGLKWDWCVSRQRYFGIPIPVWYCKKCGTEILADEKDLPVDPLKDKPKKKCSNERLSLRSRCVKCKGTEFEPEKDVFDTWFTSSSTPILSTSLLGGKFSEQSIPMDLRPQAHDIINFWLFYTLAKTQMLYSKSPWKNVMISGYALDPKGEKMSKSKGNIVEPSAVLSKYPADALRFWSAGSVLGEDLPYQEKDLHTGQKFITKIWNSSKLILAQISGFDGKEAKNLRPVDSWILSKLNTLIRDSTEAFGNYNFSKVKRDVESFYWHELCDNYLEIVKDRLYNPDKYGKDGKIAAQYVFYHVLLNLMKLIAPIMPHIAEEVYQMAYAKREKHKSIHISEWPSVREDWIDKDAEEAGELLKKIVAAVRQFKQSKRISLGAEIKLLSIYTEDAKTGKLLKEIEADLQGVSRAQKLIFEKSEGESLEIKDAPIEVKAVL